jgi:hypothetical protein
MRNVDRRSYILIDPKGDNGPKKSNINSGINNIFVSF